MDIHPVLQEAPMDGSSTPNALGTPVSLAELEAQITELAGQLNAAQYRWLLLIAEFDHRKGWSDGQLPSCAHWLNFKSCGEPGARLPAGAAGRSAVPRSAAARE